jgi:hypothetical protein
MGSVITVQNLYLDPPTNPAVLDTATWDPARAWHATEQVGDGWRLAQAVLRRGDEWPGPAGVTLARGSVAHRQSVEFCLAGPPDGQQVMVEAEFTARCGSMFFAGKPGLK